MNETILIKGARSFQFEEIVYLLEEKTHETVLEINWMVSVIIWIFKSKLKPSVKNYGKSIRLREWWSEISKLLEHHNVDYLGVAFADEGIH
jgi:alanine racemase